MRLRGFDPPEMSNAAVPRPLASTEYVPVNAASVSLAMPKPTESIWPALSEPLFAVKRPMATFSSIPLGPARPKAKPPLIAAVENAAGSCLTKKPAPIWLVPSDSIRCPSVATPSEEKELRANEKVKLKLLVGKFTAVLRLIVPELLEATE